MLANKLNYGDTIGVVGVSNSLALNNRFEDFKRAEELLISKGFLKDKHKKIFRPWAIPPKETKDKSHALPLFFIAMLCTH